MSRRTLTSSIPGMRNTTCLRATSASFARVSSSIHTSGETQKPPGTAAPRRLCVGNGLRDLLCGRADYKRTERGCASRKGKGMRLFIPVLLMCLAGVGCGRLFEDNGTHLAYLLERGAGELRASGGSELVLRYTTLDAPNVGYYVEITASEPGQESNAANSY